MKKLIYLLMSLSFVAFVSCEDDKASLESGSNGDSNGNVSAVSVYKSGTEDGHDYVDLGLTSGTLWATANVGAKTPQDYGNYYAWGETTTKANYSWSTYLDGNIASSSDCGTDKDALKGVNDIAGTQYDAAYVNWGNKWRIPTDEQQDELRNECYWVWTESYNNSNVKGYIVYKVKNLSDKGKKIYKGEAPSLSYTLSDAHIFLPAAGARLDDFLPLDAGFLGYFWSSSQSADYPYIAWNIGIISDNVYDNKGDYRFCGESVRAVISKNGGSSNQNGNNGDNNGDSNNDASDPSAYKSGTQDGHDYVDLGLTSGTKWATCNVGAVSHGSGSLFAWGETTPKSTFNWSTYLDGNIANNSDCGTSKDALKDMIDIAGTSYDAATVKWSGKWRMPTVEQWNELVNECYWVRSIGGYMVYKAKSPSDKGVLGGTPSSSYSLSDAHIFLPDVYPLGGRIVVGIGGSYWSSSLAADSPSCACGLGFTDQGVSVGGGFPRYYGMPIRAVFK